MKNLFLKILTVFAVLGIASSAYSLTIIPTWDSTITSDPSANAITNGIIQAIRAEESNVLDNVTVLIYFQEMSSGLGENDTYYVQPTYSSYLTALRNSATSVNDVNALSQIPNSSTDPLTGNSLINVYFPMAHLFGFYSGYGGTDGYDSHLLLNTSIINFTRPPGNSSKYDLIAVCEHEMDEILGKGSALPTTGGPIFPEDLFRYSTNLIPALVLTRTFTTIGDNAFFSVDGTNLFARYNQDSGADYGDWWSASALWAPLGVTPFVQVQDAYGTPDTTPNLGSNEVTALDVIGWTVAQPPAKLKILRNTKNQYTVSWSGGYVYTLQQNTNLLASNSWVNASTGTTNPAVLISTNKVEFYRLSRSLPTVLAGHALPQGGTGLPVLQITRSYGPPGQ